MNTVSAISRLPARTSTHACTLLPLYLSSAVAKLGRCVKDFSGASDSLDSGGVIFATSSAKSISSILQVKSVGSLILYLLGAAFFFCGVFSASSAAAAAAAASRSSNGHVSRV